MNFKALFQHADLVKVGLIGSGAFGNAFLFQAQAIPQITVPAVCDRNVAVARQACLQAGLPADTLAICATPDPAQDAFAARKTVITECSTTGFPAGCEEYDLTIARLGAAIDQQTI